jgi:cobalt-zinc-cadmium efflux system protein
LRLHLLEDVWGWGIVLVGAIVIKFTAWYWIDAVISIVVSIVIGVSALKLLKQSLDIFVLKTPSKINISNIKASLVIIPGVEDVHSIRILSLDDQNYIVSMHVVAEYHPVLKRIIKNTLQRQGIYNSNIEFELPTETCHDCIIVNKNCTCC